MTQAFAHPLAYTQVDAQTPAIAQSPGVAQTPELAQTTVPTAFGTDASVPLLSQPPANHDGVPPASRLARTLALGEHLSHLLGEGNGAMKGKKSPSIRQLAERLHSVIAPSSMWRAITIYQLSLKHPEMLEYTHLGVGHISVVLRFRGRLRLALMRKAEQQRWSRRRLQQVVRSIVELNLSQEAALLHFNLQAFVAD